MQWPQLVHTGCSPMQSCALRLCRLASRLLAALWARPCQPRSSSGTCAGRRSLRCALLQRSATSWSSQVCGGGVLCVEAPCDGADGVQRGLVGEIISRFERKGFKLVRCSSAVDFRTIFECNINLVLPMLLLYVLAVIDTQQFCLCLSAHALSPTHTHTHPLPYSHTCPLHVCTHPPLCPRSA